MLVCIFCRPEVSFAKLVFRLSVPSVSSLESNVLNQDIKIYVIMLCNFVLTLYKN